MELTTTEQQRLVECEATIEKGLQTFLDTGLALAEIKSKRLYRKDFSSFEQYCQDRWNLSLGKGNYLAKIGELAEGFQDLPESQQPTVPHHIKQLEILETPEQRKTAWIQAQNRVGSTGEKLTAQVVANVAKEHFLLNCDSERIKREFRNGNLSLQEGYDLYQQLYVEQKFPFEFVVGFERFGGRLETLKTLKMNMYDYTDEVLSVFTSGHLDDGRVAVPLSKLESGQVTRYFRHLAWERSQQQKIIAGKQQLKTVRGKVVSGFEVLETDLTSHQLAYIFPEGVVGNEALLKKLEQENKAILFIAVYDTEQEPTITFDHKTGETIKPSAVNGSKPYPILDMINSL